MKEKNNMMNILRGTLIVGGFGLLCGMAHSTFRHYYHKYADIEDLKTYTIQDVHLVSNLEEEI